MPAVTSRVVAVIYRGIDFPAGWADKPNFLNIGMALDTLVSVAAMFDAENRPIALCWRIGEGEDQFARAVPDRRGASSLADKLNNDLARESLRVGAEDLLGTMLWAPEELRPDQGQSVHRIVFVPGPVGTVMRPLTGWNIPPRTLVAKASQLLMMTRTVDEGLAFEMPANLDEMRQHLGSSDPHLMTVLPGSVAVAAEQNVNRKLALLFGGLIAAGALISAWLLGRP